MSPTLIALLAFLLPAPRPRPLPPPAFQRGEPVAVVAFDMAAEDPRFWRRDLEIEQRASSEFRKQKLFRVVGSPAQAGFVFLILYDVHSTDFSEAALALLPAYFRGGGQTLAQLQPHALWFGLSPEHSSWRVRLGWLPSSARALVRDFCRFTGLK